MDIEIKKGDFGVSWAIKRQLKSDGVNTEKINSCWTEIMNAFKGDAESKVNNQTIGEKWTTLASNVECAVGQVIHIAEATWAKIKEAVAKAAGKSNETTAKKASSEAGKSDKTEAKKASSEADTQSITKQECKETECKQPMVWYCERTKKYYKEVNGKLQEIKSRTGYPIKEYYKNGTRMESGNTKKGTRANVMIGDDNKKMYAYETDNNRNPVIYTLYDDNEQPCYTNKFKNGILVEYHDNKLGTTYKFTIEKFLGNNTYVLRCNDGSYNLFKKGSVALGDCCDKDGNPIST